MGSPIRWQWRGSASMNLAKFSGHVLHLRLRLLRLGFVATLGLSLVVVAASVWALHALSSRNVPESTSLAIGPALVPPAGFVPTSEQNLADFYGTLGPRRHAEQQVKTLFGLAAKNGLNLTQGQYKSALDQRGEFYTYQIVLPVSGSYAALWQFASQALATIPFASLDEISFKRESIADNRVDARMRFTLYLVGSKVAVQP